MSIPKEVISKVAQETGASEEMVSRIAETFGDLITQTSQFKLRCLWARFRCLTCIGLVRRIFWCLVAALCG